MSALLSGVRPRCLETTEAAVAGLSGLPEDRRKLYWDVILDYLPELVRCRLEVSMIDLNACKDRDDFYRKLHEVRRQEGLRSAILAQVGALLPTLPDGLDARLRGRSEPQLLQLIAKLSKAKDEAGIRAALGDRPSAKHRAHSRLDPKRRRR